MHKQLSSTIQLIDSFAKIYIDQESGKHAETKLEKQKKLNHFYYQVMGILMWIHKFDPLKVDDLFDASQVKQPQLIPLGNHKPKMELFDPSRSTAMP